MNRITIKNSLSPNRSTGRQGHIPDIIVCHITEGAFPGSINWVTNPFSEVSYHYMVSRAGEITQCVDIEDTAWANGTDNSGGSRDNRHSRLTTVRSRRINANLYTVSIGFEGRHSQTLGVLTPEQLVSGANVIGLIIDEIYDIWETVIPLSRDSIVGHRCITPRHRPNCPGAEFPFDEIIRHLQAKETSGTCAVPGQIPGCMGEQQMPAFATSPDEWAMESWSWAMDKLNMDGTRPRDNITRQEAATLMHRLHKLAVQQEPVMP